MRVAKPRRRLRPLRLSIGALRNRSIVELLVTTTATVSQISAMQVQDYRRIGGRAWVRLVTDNDAERIEPIDDRLETYLDEYIAVARIADEPATPLFRYLRADKVSRRGMTPRHVSDVIYRFHENGMRKPGAAQSVDKTRGDETRRRGAGDRKGR
jgi:site-specific recombinase XerD